MIYHIYWGTSGNSGLYLDEIYQCLKKEGFDQKVFVSYYYPFDYGEKVFFRRSDMAHCKVKGTKRKILQFIEIIKTLIEILVTAKKDKPEVVNYSLISGSYGFIVMFLKMIKRKTGCKLVITCHDVCPWGDYGEHSSEMINRKKIFEMADYLLVHNDSSIVDLKRVFKINHDKIVRHLFPIMDLTKLQAIKPIEKQCDFLFIGHLRRDKGVGFLIDSWGEFHQNHKDATLWVCGRPLGQTLDIDKLRSQNIICNLNFISDEDYCRFIQSARYVVLPYLKGTNSGIISTVLSLGANVITSDIPMFQDNPLVNKESMFKAGDKDSFISMLEKKYETSSERNIDELLLEYRKRFCEETIIAYKQILNIQ